MSSTTVKSKRPKNPTIENFLPIAKNSDYLNNNKNTINNSSRVTPCVSINATSQLCLNKASREFPYMQVRYSSQLFCRSLHNIPIDCRNKMHFDNIFTDCYQADWKVPKTTVPSSKLFFPCINEIRTDSKKLHKCWTNNIFDWDLFKSI